MRFEQHQSTQWSRSLRFRKSPTSLSSADTMSLDVTNSFGPWTCSIHRRTPHLLMKMPMKTVLIGDGLPEPALFSGKDLPYEVAASFCSSLYQFPRGNSLHRTIYADRDSLGHLGSRGSYAGNLLDWISNKKNARMLWNSIFLVLFLYRITIH